MPSLKNIFRLNYNGEFLEQKSHFQKTTKKGIKVFKSKFMGLLALPFVFASATNAAENLSAESAGAGGVTHTVTSHFAQILSEAGVAELQVQSGATLTNTLQNVANGTTDVGITPLILPFLLKNGRGPYAKTGKEEGSKQMDNIRALFPYNLGAFHLFAYESTGLKSWDLAGKVVYNGPPRGGALTNARQVISVVTGLKDGEGYTGLQVNWGQMSKTITDNSAEANVLPFTIPSDIMIGALSAGNINLISVPKDIYEGEAFQKLTKGPGSAPIVVPIDEMGYTGGVNIISEDGYWRGMVTTGAQVVNKDMSFDLAKAMTATHIANIDKLIANTAYAKNLGLNTAGSAGDSGFCGAVGMKYHPGAVAAWEEAGVKIPDCAKP